MKPHRLNARGLALVFLLLVTAAFPAVAQQGGQDVGAEMSRLFNLSQQARARKDYNTARQALETAIRYAQGSSDGYSVGVFTGALASVYSEAGQYDRAIALGQQALNAQIAAGDKKNIPATLSNLGLDNVKAGHPERAFDYYNRAISAYQELGKSTDVTRTAITLSRLYRRTGQERKGDDLLSATVRTAEAGNDPGALYDALTEQGGVAQAHGQLDQARTVFQRCLAAAQRVNDKKLTAGALNNLGQVVEQLGQKKQALDYYERAVALIEPGDVETLAPLLVNLGNVAMSFGDAETAVRYLTRAVQVEQTRGDRMGLAGALDSLGSAYSRLSQWDKAIEQRTRALTIVQPLGDMRETARILGNLGGTCKGKGDYAKAVDYLTQSLSLKRKYANPEELAGSLTNLALIYYDQNKLDQAAAAFAEAITDDEIASWQVREATKVGEYQDGLRSSMYRRYAQVLLDQHKPEDALVVLERGRNQGLARQAAQNRADFGNVLPPNDAQRLRTAISRFKSADEDRKKIEGFEGLADSALPSAERAAILATRSRYDEAERTLALTRQDLGARYPAYRKLAFTAPPSYADLKQLADQHPDTLYLEWGIGWERTSLLFALSQKDGLKSFVLPLNDRDLHKQVRAWREQITEADDPKTEGGLASGVFNSLLGEVEKAGLLAPGKFGHLVLVGDGPLLEVPFAAVRDAAGKRLAERFPVAVSVSLSVLTWPDMREKAQGSLLCAADPEAPGAPKLPAARKEGQAVAALFPGSSLLVGAAARRGVVSRDLGRYNLLHFATHGYLDDEDGLKSGLVLTPDPGSEDEILEARDLIGTRLAAQLAVLSACETGQGQKSGGEGLLGLTWAFRAAGCPCVVASLWSVDDDATAQLMVGFYQGLKAGKLKDEALRDAMLAVRGRKADPFFWAAFQVNGETAALKL